MSALITRQKSLINLSAAHRMIVRGDSWMEHARQAEAAKLDAAIARNLKELGYDETPCVEHGVQAAA